MKPIQFALASTAAFAGCFAGSWLALRPTPVYAQQNVRVDEYLNVPNGGLRLQNSRGRVLGIIGEQNGSAIISLMAPDGTPSVQIYGGQGGTIALGVSEGTSGLEVKGAHGEAASLLAQSGKGVVAVGNNQAKAEMVGGAESRLTIPGSTGGTQLELMSSPDGGLIKVLNNGGPMIELSSSGGKGRLLVNGPGPSGVRVDGAGLLEILQSGKSVFSAPQVKAQALPLAL